LASPTLALIVALALPIDERLRAVVFAVFIAIFVMRGAIEHSLVLGMLGYLMDSAAQRHRAMYVGAINTLSGVVALTPLLGGAWIDLLSKSGHAQLAYITLFGFVAVCVATGLWLSFHLPRHGRT
jgi:hypothetical protein